jgi:hypothetical protein
MRHVFVALVEIRPQERCELLDPAEVNGAVVRCYIPAGDEPSARARLATYLSAHKLDMVAIEWLVREDQVEWDNPDDATAQQLIHEARDSDEIATAEFHWWGHDAPDAGN